MITRGFEKGLIVTRGYGKLLEEVVDIIIFTAQRKTLLFLVRSKPLLFKAT